jgi:hypothetical protein
MRAAQIRRRNSNSNEIQRGPMQVLRYLHSKIECHEFYNGLQSEKSCSNSKTCEACLKIPQAQVTNWSQSEPHIWLQEQGELESFIAAVGTEYSLLDHELCWIHLPDAKQIVWWAFYWCNDTKQETSSCLCSMRLTSVIGVSSTRSGPNFCKSPFVTCHVD